MPLNPFRGKDPEKSIPQPTPDQNCSIRKDLREDVGRKMHQTVAFRVPVGQWTGNNETPNVLINSSKANFSWGWGHPANLALNVPYNQNYGGTVGADIAALNKVAATTTNNMFVSTAPYLRYELDNENWRTQSVLGGAAGFDYRQGHITRLHAYPCSTEFVDPSRWSTACR